MSFHAGQTFTFGEQPSATKWQYLWDNDYALADGTGISNDAILTRHILNGNVTDAKWRNAVAFHAYATGTIAMTGGVFTKMTGITTEKFDLGSNFNTGTTRFVAPYNGIYLFNGTFSVPNNDTRIFASIYVNGAEHGRGTNGSYSGTANRGQCCDIVTLTAGDYVELFGWRAANGNGQFEAETGISLQGVMITRT